MAPSLCEDFSPSPTPTFLEAWRAPGQPGACSRGRLGSLRGVSKPALGHPQNKTFRSFYQVAHELPPHAFRAVAAEAFRLLAPGGQLWLSEMDFETQSYMKLRSNLALYSLIRATEPYLDEYAEYQTSGALAADLLGAGFAPVKMAAATGRHFACVATKPACGERPSAEEALIDLRAATAKADTHLMTWEAKAAGGGVGGGNAGGQLR